MKHPKFLRNKKTGVVFGYNDALAKHPDMIPHDGDEPPAEEKVVKAPASRKATKQPPASPTTGAAAAAVAAADAALQETGAESPIQVANTGGDQPPAQE